MTTSTTLDANTSFTPTTSTPKPRVWRSRLGWGISALPCLLVLMSGVNKLGPLPEAAVQGMRHVGIEQSLAKPLGVLEILIAVACLNPGTAFIGAILFTGWAGGAIQTHWRVGDPFVVQALMPVLVWIGLGLRRTAEIRSLLAWKRRA